MLHAAEINIVQLAHAKMIFNFVCMFLYRARRLSKNVVCLGTKPIFFQFIPIMNTLFSISEKQIFGVFFNEPPTFLCSPWFTGVRLRFCIYLEATTWDQPHRVMIKKYDKGSPDLCNNGAKGLKSGCCFRIWQNTKIMAPDWGINQINSKLIYSFYMYLSLIRYR